MVEDAALVLPIARGLQRVCELLYQARRVRSGKGARYEKTLTSCPGAAVRSFRRVRRHSEGREREQRV